GAQPGVIPILTSRWLVGPACHIQDIGDDSFVVPVSRELGLAWLPDSVPVAAAAARLAVEDVGGPLRADVDVLRLRPVLGIHRIPPRTIRLARPTAAISRPTVSGGPERLVVLLAATRLGRLRPLPGNIAIRNLPLGAV